MAPTIKEKSQNMLAKWAPGDSPMHPKIYKNGHLDLKVPVGCPMVSLWMPGTPKWSLRVPKWSLKFSKITVWGTNKKQPYTNCDDVTKAP